ncbi:MAG: ankyrin repeat domain-containing protein [Vicinamibacterales bacterium]
MMNANRRVLAGICAVLVAAAGTATAAEPDRRVVEAARQRDGRAVAALIRQRADVNVPQADGATALHWAAQWDDLAMAGQLLKAGARAGALNDYGVMPLSLAATNGSAPMIEALVAAGASPNAALPTGESVLMTASRTGRVDAVKALIARGADVNARQTSKGQTALMWATAERHAPVVEALVAAGADVHARTESGFSPLLFAAREGDQAIAALLLQQGADVNESAPDGSTPLLVATVRGHVPMAQWLLERGAKPDGDAAAAGFTPLHWASTRSEGVITNDYPEAPGEWAALAGIPDRGQKLALINALLAKGAAVNAQVSKDLPRYGFSLFKRNYLPGGTPFYLAALVGDVEVMKLLLAKGADRSITAKDGTTPLMVAAGIAHADNESRVSEADHLEAVKLTLELGDPLDGTNRAGFTAMHAAAYAGFDSVVRFLAGKGAKLSEVAKNGQSPLGIAEGNNLSGFFFERVSTAALLRELGAKSEGAVTLEGFIKKQVGNRGATRRDFDAEKPAGAAGEAK